MSDYKAKQRKQEKGIQSSKKGTLVWISSEGQGTYYTGANQIKKANKGMKAKLMRLMENMR
jgi:hypothetical protein